MAKGFVCPKCQSTNVGVIQTMPLAGAIKRRRKCFTCDVNFITYEVTSEVISTDPAFDFLFRKAPAQ